MAGLRPAQDTAPTPSPTAKPNAKRYTSREELLRDADKFAIEQLGFEDENGNGIPDYRETYVINSHDCTTVSAEFDYIVDQMGKAGVMDPAQAQGTVQICGGNHAANIVPGLGIVDVTPVGTNGSYVASRGQPWYPFDRTGYTEYADGFPDGGELTFKGYNGPRTNTAPGAVIRGSGSFGAGGAASVGMIAALSGLLQNGAFQPPPMAPDLRSSTSGKPSAGGSGSTRPAPVKTPAAQAPSTVSRSPQTAPAPTSTSKIPPAPSAHGIFRLSAGAIRGQGLLHRDRRD